jgi:hypothetical protein
MLGKMGVADRKISRVTSVSTTLRPPPFPKTPVSGQRLSRTLAHPHPAFGHPLPIRWGEGWGEGLSVVQPVFFGSWHYFSDVNSLTLEHASRNMIFDFSVSAFQFSALVLLVSAFCFPLYFRRSCVGLAYARV